MAIMANDVIMIQVLVPLRGHKHWNLCVNDQTEREKLLHTLVETIKRAEVTQLQDKALWNLIIQSSLRTVYFLSSFKTKYLGI